MIDVQNVTYAYAGKSAPAVQDLVFQVQKGEVFGFLGPSGSGKSTTQRTLIGLLRGYQGSIRVFDRELKEWGSDLYERIGVCFELPNHYQKLTALENLRLFGALYKRETLQPMALLTSVGLEEDANTRLGAFSKGMAMRLNFARAILNQPDLLFLDEPTAGLDPGNARRIKDRIFALREQGCTIFLTTHDMQVADELCDRVAFLVDGKISVMDSPRNLKLRYGRRILRLEYRSDHRLERAEFPLEGLAEQEQFLSLLRSGSVETIHTEEASLEEIFLQITGRNLS
jgi:fluoroquinolone transport system ATP-binding protein